MEKYAGFWIRFVAAIIDGIVVAIPEWILMFILSIILTIIKTPSTVTMVIVNLISIVATFAYYILMTHYKGATLGKMLVGIRVKSANEIPLTIGRVALRETIGKIISSIIFGIGYLMAAFTGRKQGLHDVIAKTVVVYNDPSKPMGAGAIIAIVITCIVPALAIMGVLASVVLVSLNTARTKADDAKTMSLIHGVIPFLEMHLEKNGSYAKAQNCNSGVFLDQNIQQIFSSMKNKNVTCVAENNSYAISAKLNNNRNYCLSRDTDSDMAEAVIENGMALCKSIPSSSF